MVPSGSCLRVAALCLVLFGSTTVYGFSFGRRSFAQQERCIVFESECTTYTLNIAVAYRIPGGKWRVRGWMNLAARQTAEVCWTSVSSHVYVLVNNPNDDIGCFINPIVQRGGFQPKKAFCIDSDAFFDIEQSIWKKQFFFGLSRQPSSQCSNGFAACHRMLNFERFSTGPRHSVQPERLKCP